MRDHLKHADAARDRQDWDVARAEYKRVLDLQPGRADIWVQFGHAQKELGHIQDATKAYQEALRLEPSLSDTHLQLGHALKLQGRLDEAGKAYASALALDATSGDAVQELERLGFQASPELGHPASPRPGDAAVGSVERRHAILAEQGLRPDLLSRFDPDLYARTRNIQPPADEEAFEALLCHFCQFGVEHLAPLNKRDAFDPAFYRELHNPNFSMSDTDLYRYWLNLGLQAGQAPNLGAWMTDTLGLPLGAVAQIDLGFFREANRDLHGMTDTAVIEWLVDGGLLDERLDGPPTPDGLELMSAAASRAAVRGQRPLAAALLERVLVHRPMQQPEVQAYADRLVDLEQPFQATAFYEKILAAGIHDRWTHTHLHVALMKQRRFDEAFSVMAEGATRYRQYPQLEANVATGLDAFFHHAVGRYNILAKAGRLAEGQALMTRFCEVVTADRTLDVVPPRPIRSVALFSLVDLPQCRFYRVDQKIEQLEEAGFEVELYDSNKDLGRFLAEIRRFQAVIFYRLAPLPDVVTAIQAAREMGLVTFYEIDDLLFLASEYPGTLESYAGQIDRDTFNMLAMGVPLFLSAMRMCDYALASTPTLAREMMPFVRHRQAFVHRNGMGTDHERYLDYATPERPADQPVMIFYGSGTRAHKEDFQQLIEPALVEIARKHGSKVTFVMVGWLPISEAFRKAAGDRLVLVEPVFDLHAYWEMLKEADINLAVLKRNLNTDSKSEIKWMEAAMFGIPSVVSRTATYGEVIEEGETGFLCDTVAEWTRTLDRLIREPVLRRRVGLAAQAKVRRDYPIAAMARNIGDILASVSPPELPRRKKILVVNVFYAPQLYGGATRVMHDNILHLARTRGELFDFEVFTCRDEAGSDYEVRSYAQDGIPVTAVSRSVAGETSGEISDPEMAEIFRTHLELTRPDMIHFHCIQRLTLAVVEVARALEIPYVITAHDAWWISDNQFLIDRWGKEQVYDYANPRRVLVQQGQKAFNRMQSIRPALEGAQAVLGVSEPFSALYRRCGVAKVRTVANGVSALVPAERTSSPDGRVRLGHFGGMVKHKGFDLLQQVLLAENFTRLSLVVIDHSKPKSYRRHETWGGTPVTIAGKVGQAEVAALYAAVDVVVAPSLWSESYGLVTREAQLCGCWVVASDRGAIGTDVTDGVNGFVVDVQDADGLRKALERLNDDPERFTRPPPALPVRTAEDQGDELGTIYRSILGV